MNDAGRIAREAADAMPEEANRVNAARDRSARRRFARKYMPEEGLEPPTRGL